MAALTRVRDWLLPSRGLSLDQYLGTLESVLYNGHRYPILNQTLPGEREEYPDASFAGYVQAAYQRNGVVFACLLARLSLFSEARFQFRQLRSGRPGKLFGTDALRLLETPWPNGTTGDLLARMIQDADLAGNAYMARRNGGLRRMRPDWTTIVCGVPAETASESADELDAVPLGYIYKPGGPSSRFEPLPLMPEDVAHFAPIPDPGARFRGMSILSAAVRELMADNAMTSHKLKFHEQGATVNLAVKTGLKDPEKFKLYVDLFKKAHRGTDQAYETLFLAEGADVIPLGSNLQQIDFKIVQGAGETRIAAVLGVPPVIVGLSEGLAAATYSNYGQARRRFADGTMRVLWRQAAGALASIIDVPAGAELWYDDRDIPFLKEDLKDSADIAFVEAQAMRTLVDGGFDPSSVRDAVVAGDWALLNHTGLPPVQVQPKPPGSDAEADPAAPPANGSGNGRSEDPAVKELVSALAQRGREDE